MTLVRCALAAAAMNLLLSSAALGQPLPDPAALRAYGEQLIASTSEPHRFTFEENQYFTFVRDRLSGLRCEFPLNSNAQINMGTPAYAQAPTVDCVYAAGSLAERRSAYQPPPNLDVSADVRGWVTRFSAERPGGHILSDAEAPHFEHPATELLRVGMPLTKLSGSTFHPTATSAACLR